jgi:FERM central domain
VHTPAFFKGMLKDILPPAASKDKGIDKDVAAQWKKILGMTELNAKFRYIQLSRSLKTYGITCFNVNEILTDLGKKRILLICLIFLFLDFLKDWFLLCWELHETLCSKWIQLQRRCLSLIPLKP